MHLNALRASMRLHCNYKVIATGYVASAKGESDSKEDNMNKNKFSVRKMVELGVLTAIILIMAFTPLGYLMTPWGIQITLIVIPVAVGGIILGPKAGAFLGLVFGLTSFSQSFSNVLGQQMLNANPIGTFYLLVGNRVLVGLIPALIYRGFRKINLNKSLSITICAFLTPITNTVLYILANWLIFKDTWLSNDSLTGGYNGNGGFTLLVFMLGLVAVNGIVEAIACTIIGSAICQALVRTVNKESSAIPYKSQESKMNVNKNGVSASVNVDVADGTM
jgi:uncharacterized membrane protein